MSTSGITGFELERRERMAANEITMKSLGVRTSAELLADTVKKSKLQEAQKRQRPKVAVDGPPKKSARLALASKVLTTGGQQSENADNGHCNEELDDDCAEEEDADEELRRSRGSGTLHLDLKIWHSFSSQTLPH